MGPREVAKMETTERMSKITSRFHSGQFYDISARHKKWMGMAHKRIVWIITGLRNQYNWDRA
jgi:hypothetical protein